MKKINLLPDEYQKRAFIKIILKTTILLTILSLMPFIGVTIYFKSAIHLKTNELNQLSAAFSEQNHLQSDNTHDETLNLMSEKEQYKQIENFITSIPEADITHIDYISNSLPNGVYLTNLIITGNKNVISIAGVADSRKSLAEYLENLSNIKNYSEIKLKELSFQNDEAVNYVIEITQANE